jgi:hypothetical protein
MRHATSGALRLALALTATVVAGTGPTAPAGPVDAAPPPTTGFRAPPAGLLAAEDPDEFAFHEFRFTRAAYTDFRPRRSRFLGDGGPAWSTDFPNGDRHFMVVARRLSSLDASQREHFISLADPEIRRFPFLYAVEVGWMTLTEPEVKGLRDFLGAGGFLVIDDFWGSDEWEQFERQIARVLPGRPIVDIPRDHLLYRIFYDIEGEILQVPNVGNAEEIAKGLPHARTWERDGYKPHLRGIFDDEGRLLVVINWNTDLGDAWEHADYPFYPLKFSTFACELGLNMILYGMTE